MVTTARGDDTRLPGALAMVLLALLVILSPSLRTATLMVAIMGIVLVWLLGRIGLAALLLVPLELVFLGRRGTDQTITRPILVFRAVDGPRSTTVDLYGHNTGVQLGDRVQFLGPQFRGTVHALRVVNRTSGQVLYRVGVARLGALCALDLVLFLAVLGQLGSRA